VNNGRVDWHGSFAVIVTPFTREGDIDEDGYRRVVELVIEAGCHGVISAGSTGQFFLMSADERKRVIAIAADQASGRVPVLAGTSAIRPEDVIDLTSHAREVGCAGAMVLPPLYVPLTEDETGEFYRRIAGESGLPIMLYNSPAAVPTVLGARLVEQLARLENVVAIKDSSLDMRQLNDLVRFCGNELRVFIGLEDLLLPAMAVGAVGAVAMLPPLVGRMAVELYESAAAGDMQRALGLHRKMLRAYDLFNVGSGYLCIKECMNMLGKPGGYSRPPMRPLSEGQKAQLREILCDIGLLKPDGSVVVAD